MSLIINVGPAYPSSPPAFVAPNASVAVRRSVSPSVGETVELSRPGRVLPYAVEESRFRIARIQSIRTEIQAGTYETPERINGTVERLLDVLA